MSHETETTALALPEKNSILVSLRAKAIQLRDRAAALFVRSPEEAQVATVVLADLAQIRKAVEEQRLLMTAPHEQYQRAVNTFVKDFMGPIKEGDDALRAKVLAFQREEKAKAEEEANRKYEEAAAAERAASEKAQRTAREAEAARQAAAAAVKEADFFAAFDAREKARRAEEDRLTAEERAREKKTEAARASTPVTVAPVRTASGATATTKEHWKFAVEQFGQVPSMYLILNEVAVRRAIAGGVRDIPGLRIFDEGQLAVGGGRR